MPHLLLQVTYHSRDHVLFEKCHITNARPQKSAGDTKHKKSLKSKALFIIQKILTFDYLIYIDKHHFKGTLSDPRQFLTTESPFSFSMYLHFCLDFLFMLKTA